MAGNNQLDFFACSRFFKTHRQIVAQIRTALHTTTAATTKTTAKHLTEGITEQIAKITIGMRTLEAAGTETAHHVINTGMAVLIIAGAFIFIG